MLNDVYVTLCQQTIQCGQRHSGPYFQTPHKKTIYTVNPYCLSISNSKPFPLKYFSIIKNGIVELLNPLIIQKILSCKSSKIAETSASHFPGSTSKNLCLLGGSPFQKNDTTS